MLNTVLSKVDKNLKDTIKMRAFTLAKIPLLGLLSPTIKACSDTRVEVKFPLNFLSKNHLGSMYFAALAAGADLAIGLPVIDEMNRTGEKFHFLFKDFKANFLKRAEGGDVHFICEEVAGIKTLLEKARTGRERVNQTFKAFAVVPKVSADHVAEFELTLSIKAK